MNTSNEIFTKVTKNMNSLVDANIDWTDCATAEMIDDARNGNMKLQLGFPTIIPKEWFGDEIKGKKILCLAGAGGLQGPIMAAAGGIVTVLDISDKMLKKDIHIAERDNLNIKIVQGN